MFSISYIPDGVPNAGDPTPLGPNPEAGDRLPNPGEIEGDDGPNPALGCDPPNPGATMIEKKGHFVLFAIKKEFQNQIKANQTWCTTKNRALCSTIEAVSCIRCVSKVSCWRLTLL